MQFGLFKKQNSGVLLIVTTSPHSHVLNTQCTDTHHPCAVCQLTSRSVPSAIYNATSKI